MDENDWLEDALNFRDNADIKTLAKYASSNIKKFIGHGYLSQFKENNVTELQKLYTSLRRVYAKNDGMLIEFHNNIIYLEVTSRNLMMSDNVLFSVICNRITKRYAELIDSGKFTMSEPIKNTATITETETHIVITKPNNAIKIKKPINRQRKLAFDIGEYVSRDNHDYDAKRMNNYYYINSRPSKNN